PDGGQDLIVGTSGGVDQQVRWVKYGSIGNLKIELSKDGGLSWLTAAESNLSDSWPAGPNGPAEVAYTWTIPDQVSNLCKVKISTTGDYPIGGDVLADITTGVFNIKGGFNSLSIPGAGAVLYVGNPQNITWNAIGTMRAVDIDLYNGVGWSSITAGDDNGGSNWNHGNNTYGWSPVDDERSNNCKVRVRSVDNPGQEIESGVFTISPNITVNTPGDLLAETPCDVQWSYVGTETTLVDILLDVNGDGNWADAITIDDGAGAGIPIDTQQPHTTAGALPSGLSANARMRVLDHEAGYSYVYGDTGTFKIIGQISIVEPDSASRWTVGDATRKVRWTKKGDMGFLNFYYNYGSGWSGIIGSEDDDVGEWTWPAVQDHVSNNVQVRVTDASHEADTSVDSVPFRITCSFDFSPYLPAVFRIDKYGNPMNIQWDTNGTDVSEVRLQYSVDGGLYQDIDASQPITNRPPAQGYDWSVPAGISSSNVKLRITATTPDQPSTEHTSGQFSILGGIYVDTPSGVEKWVAGSNGNLIEWELAGGVDNVKIMYSNTGAAPFPEIITTSTDADNVDATHGSFPWDIPADITKDLLSKDQAIIRVQDADYATVYGDSPKFMVKGILQVDEPDNTTLVCGSAQDITWTRVAGGISTVDVLYSTDSGQSYPNTLATDVAFGVAAAQKTIAWPGNLPEVVGLGYQVKVVDHDNDETEAESPVFIVKGELKVTMPDDQQPTWYLTDLKQITWNVEHGNIQNVKITASRSGNFTGLEGGADIFVITSSTPAAGGSADWDIQEKTPSIIGDELKVKVEDANQSYDVETVSSQPFTVRGKIEVTEPESTDVLQVDAPFDVEWKTWGDAITHVKIEYSTDGDSGPWTEIEPSYPTSGVLITTYPWTPDDSVAVTDDLYIRVTDATEPSGVSDVSSGPSELKGW
ncbi:hypothetical protein ACFL2W_01075, partial [Candidatus Omnitrophota bacterium]